MRFLRSQDFLWLTLIVVIGGALRGGLLWEHAHSPEFGAPVVDASFHHYWAKGLATGAWQSQLAGWVPPTGEADPQIPSNPYLRPPGYPHLLGMIYRLFGLGPLAPCVVQQLLGLLNCLLAYAVVRNAMGRTCGLLCAAFLAVYWPVLYFELQLLEPAPFMTLLLWLLWLLESWSRSFSWRACLMGGAILGMSALFRPNTLLFAPMVVAWMFWAGHRASVAGLGSGGGSTRRIGASATAFGFGLLIAVAPATIRNYAVAGDTVLISANAGVNLYIGNNPASDGLYQGELLDLGSFGTCFDYPRITRKLEQRLGRDLSYSDVSRYFGQQAWRHIRQHPADTAKLMIRKLFLFWSPRELSHNRVVELDRENSAVLSRLPGGFPFLFASSLLGCVVFWGPMKQQQQGLALAEASRTFAVLLLGMIIIYAGSFLPFFNSALYRVPLVPLLAMFAAYSWKTVLEGAIRREYRRTGAVCVLGLVIFLVVRVSYVRYEANPAEWHSTKAWAFTQQEDHARAEAHYKSAAELDPNNAAYHSGLARALTRQGKLSAADRAWSQAIQLEHGNPAFHYEYGMLCYQTGRLEDAADHLDLAIQLGADFVAPYHNLGQIRLEQGDTEDAIRLFRGGIEKEPRSAAVRAGLGIALIRLGQHEQAIQELETATRLDPGFHLAQLHLGLAYLATSMEQAAVEALQRAVAMQPNHVPSRIAFADALKAAGNVNASISQLEIALGLDAANDEALNRLRRLRQP